MKTKRLFPLCAGLCLIFGTSSYGQGVESVTKISLLTVAQAGTLPVDGTVNDLVNFVNRLGPYFQNKQLLDEFKAAYEKNLKEKYPKSFSDFTSEYVGEHLDFALEAGKASQRMLGDKGNLGEAIENIIQKDPPAKIEDVEDLKKVIDKLKDELKKVNKEKGESDKETEALLDKFTEKLNKLSEEDKDRYKKMIDDMNKKAKDLRQQLADNMNALKNMNKDDKKEPTKDILEGIATILMAIAMIIMALKS